MASLSDFRVQSNVSWGLGAGPASLLGSKALWLKLGASRHGLVGQGPHTCKVYADCMQMGCCSGYMGRDPRTVWACHANDMQGSDACR